MANGGSLDRKETIRQRIMEHLDHHQQKGRMNSRKNKNAAKCNIFLWLCLTADANVVALSEVLSLCTENIILQITDGNERKGGKFSALCLNW